MLWYIRRIDRTEHVGTLEWIWGLKMELCGVLDHVANASDGTVPRRLGIKALLVCISKARSAEATKASQAAL